MSNEVVKNFLDGFSLEVTPRAASKIDNFADLIPKDTLIYIAHIEGTPIEDMTSTAKKINEAISKGKKIVAVGTTVLRLLEGCFVKYSEISIV